MNKLFPPNSSLLVWQIAHGHNDAIEPGAGCITLDHGYQPHSADTRSPWLFAIGRALHWRS
jgi:hypothetical protein